MDFQAQEKATAGIFKFLASSITIGVISLLLAVTINPIEFVRFQRDRQRTRDLKSLSDLILKVEEAVPRAIKSVGNFVYLSLPDNDPNCSSWSNKGLPPIPNGYVYRCVNDVNLTRTDGYGWLPIDFKELPGISLSKLPLDPRNGTVGYDSEKEKDVLYFYQYVAGSPILSYSSSESDSYNNKRVPLDRSGVERSGGFVSISGSLPGSNGEVFLANETEEGLLADVREIYEVSRLAIKEALASTSDSDNAVDALVSASLENVKESIESSGGEVSLVSIPSVNSFISFVGNVIDNVSGSSGTSSSISQNNSDSEEFSNTSSNSSETTNNQEAPDTQSFETNSEEQNISNDPANTTSGSSDNDKICLNLGGTPSGSGVSFRCSIIDNKAPDSNQNDFGSVLPKYVLIPRDYKFYKQDFTSMTGGQNDTLNWSGLSKPTKINVIHGVVNEGFVDVPARALSFKLQQAPLVNSLSCNNLESWSDVTTASRPLAYDTLSNFIDDSPIVGTTDSLKMGVDEVLQTWQNQGGLVNSKEIKKGDAGVFGFNLRVSDATPTGIDCLRMVFADGSLLYYYSPVLPQIIFSNDVSNQDDPAWIAEYYSAPTTQNSTLVNPMDMYNQYCVNQPDHTLIMAGAFECINGSPTPIQSQNNNSNTANPYNVYCMGMPNGPSPMMPSVNCINGEGFLNTSASVANNANTLASAQFDKKRWKKFFASVYDVFSTFYFFSR